MEMVRLGKTEMIVSKLGFGGIPIQRVSEDEAIAVVKRCLELGITYIETANAYTNSEERIGKAIGGQREGLVLATKPHILTREGVESDLQNSLKMLGVESIDLYQFHNVSNLGTLDMVLDPDGPMAVLEEAKRAGKVKHIGASSHQIDVAKEAVKSGRFETIMFPFNFIACEAADELVPLAREHDVGFIAMKPLHGGVLRNVTIAIKYLLQFPNVVVLVGIEKISEIEEIIRVVEGPWQMTEAEQSEMERLRAELDSTICRRCDYCLPCPEGIPISLVMDFNCYTRGMPSENIFSGHFAEGLAKAAECTKCGDCEEGCPYHLPVQEMIAEYVDRYETLKKKYQEQAI